MSEFVKGKSGLYKNLVAQAAQEWANTPEAMEGKAKRAEVRGRRSQRGAKERAAKKAVTGAQKNEEDLELGLSTSGGLGDDFDGDDEPGVVVPVEAFQTLGDDFEEDDAVPLTQPDGHDTMAEAGDASATSESGAMSTAKPVAKAKAKQRAKKCGDAAVSEEARDVVKSGGSRRKSAAISEHEAADEPEAAEAPKLSKRCRKAKVAAIPFL